MAFRKKIYLLMLAMLGCTIASLPAQSGGNTAFKGGAGDGYDMAELETQPLSAAAGFSEIGVHPNILQQGQAIRLPHGIVPEQAYLTGTNGVSFAVSVGLSTGTELVIPAIPHGLYILRLDNGDGRRYHAKIVVMQP